MPCSTGVLGGLPFCFIPAWPSTLSPLSSLILYSDDGLHFALHFANAIVTIVACVCLFCSASLRLAFSPSLWGWLSHSILRRDCIKSRSPGNSRAAQK